MKGNGVETTKSGFESIVNKLFKEEFRKRIGKIVEKFRLEKGISRKELGESLGYRGNSAVQVVARFESGRAGIPKNKIEKLLSVLQIKNADFGLDEAKSLKHFIASGGFMGSAGAAFGKTWVDFMEATEAENIKSLLSSDHDESEEGENDDDRQQNYTGTVRLMRIFRTGSPPRKHDLEFKLNCLYDLAEGDDDRLIDLMVTTAVDPDAAYDLIERKIIERLELPPDS